MKNKNLNEMSENSGIQTIADNFAADFSNEDLQAIKDKEPADLKEYLSAVCLATLEFAEENTGKTISILPGRPSRPNKPTV